MGACGPKGPGTAFRPVRLLALALLLAGPAGAGDVHFLILPSQTIGPISPYIYGLNDQDPAGLNVTLRRLGGNRLTGYNWTNNASNAGSDWHQTSDDWLCADHAGDGDSGKPGALAFHFVEQDQAEGLASLLTLPMAGYVAADKDGEVTQAQTAPSPRWARELPRKGAPFTLDPDPASKTVYDDEFVNFLKSRFGPAGQGGPVFYDLDNEPALWPSTHPRLHPAKPTYREMVERTQALASAVLDVDPSAVLFGGVMYGWQEMRTLQDAPDSAPFDQTYGTYTDYYLAQMREAEKRTGRRLVQVLDLHWYPEAQGAGKRITQGDTSPDSVEARLQAPRSLWDPGYVEKSWITRDSTQGAPIALIPWLQAKIDRWYPGTKLAFSEYDYGAGDHVSGGLAQADVLGIFGKYGVFEASYWGDLKAYNRAAFDLYRDYDGHDSTFGGEAVSAGTENVVETSVYAAVDPASPGRLWIVALNKDPQRTLHGVFEVRGQTPYARYQAYGFNARSPAVKPVRSGSLDQGRFDLDLPPLSATIFVCAD
ncbi:MAG TPA: glycoside hydrolase family 44 protein [bacterium]|nr:glycoside hydrolase family 44 protein [bacterium]